MHKVLVVEDAISYSNFLKASIEHSGEFSVITCHTLAQTSQLLESDSDFIAAVLDLNLPDAPNGEVVDLVIKKNIPSIVITASINEDLRLKIIARPIVDYLLKTDKKDINDILLLLYRIKNNPLITVLVIDDDKGFREYISFLLQNHCYQVLTANNGKEGLESLQKHHEEISLVITDYNMPEMDGLDFTRQARQLFSKTEVCIIGLTSDSTPLASVNFLKAGANDLIKKPFLIEEFYSRVTHHLDLVERIQEIQDMAVRDHLTGLYNRRFLFEQGNKKYIEAKKQTAFITTAILDIDYFKNVNDRYGHNTGDEAIRQVAQVLRNFTNRRNIASRFGGEEFCMILFNIESPATFFEMIRRDIEKLVIIANKNEVLKLTISIGFDTSANITMSESIRLADLALYKAKEMGRNRVIESSGISLADNEITQQNIRNDERE